MDSRKALSAVNTAPHLLKGPLAWWSSAICGLGALFALQAGEAPKSADITTEACVESVLTDDATPKARRGGRVSSVDAQTKGRRPLFGSEAPPLQGDSLRALKNRLSVAEAEILRMYYVDAQPQDVICRSTGISHQDLRQVLEHARASFRAVRSNTAA